MKEVENMEVSQCVVLEPTVFVNIKQEVFPEDCALSNERISLKQEIVADDSLCSDKTEEDMLQGMQCVLLREPDAVLRQEVFIDECALSNESINLRQDNPPDDPLCLDKTDSLPESAVINAVYISEETGVYSVVKEELPIIENCYSEDTCEMSTSINVGAVVNEDTSQDDYSGAKSCESEKSKYDVSCSDVDHPRSVSQHALSNSGVNKYQCDVCNKSYIQLSNLSRHKKFHCGLKKYHCDVCNKVFARFSILSRHKKIHSGVKNYQCDVCNKAFGDKTHLSQHKIMHTDVKNYKCDICNKSFSRKHNLSDHMLFHSGIKNYYCDVCNKAFTHSSNLAYHKLIHSGVKNYQCHVCNKAFTYSNVLAHHMFIHSGVKDYQCNICNKTFARLGTLSRHKLTHSGVNYHCDVCNKAFRDKPYFLKHKLTHTCSSE